VGVVDLGEQSAILVEVNGVAQRFRLGESIGSSGWALVEVSKNQAIIRRNGEVRSVFIGQNF
jgi:type II secretory pathway component PulC